MDFHELFKVKKPIIGMIHLAGKDPVRRALEELKIFEDEGISGAIVENYHGDRSDVERTLEIIARRDYKLIIGVNILPNNFYISIPMAHKYCAEFVQLDYVAGRYIGIIGRASSNVSRVKQLDHTSYKECRTEYPGVLVLGGVYPKYYEPVPYSNLEDDLRKGVERAEVIVVTSDATGIETPIEKIREFRRILGDYPLIVGAGLNPENAEAQLSIADGAIVGSAFKLGNRTENPLDIGRIRNLMKIVEAVRSSSLLL